MAIPRIKIDRIEVLGFLRFRHHEVFKFNEFTNLLSSEDGNDYPMTLFAITKAIDFLLSPSFEEADALQYVHTKFQTHVRLMANPKDPLVSAREKTAYNVNGEKRDPYVKIRLSSNQHFVLNGNSRKQFEITRYLLCDKMGFVFYGDNRRGTKQSIKAFYMDLMQLRMVRISDPMITRCSFPTGSELKSWFVDAGRFEAIWESLQISDWLKELAETNIMGIRCVVDHRVKTYESADAYLRPLRTIEHVLACRDIANFDENYEIAQDFNAKMTRKQYLKITENDLVTSLREDHKKHSDVFDQKIVALSKLPTPDAVLNTGQMQEFNAAIGRLLNESDFESDLLTKGNEVNLRNYRRQQLYLDRVASEYQQGNQTESPASVVESLKSLAEDIKTARIKIKAEIDQFPKSVEEKQETHKERIQEKYEALTGRLARENDLSKARIQAIECLRVLSGFLSDQSVLQNNDINGLDIGWHVLAADPNLGNGFIGQMVDFLDLTNVKDNSVILSVLSSYFMMFFFNQKVQADRFLHQCQAIGKDLGLESRVYAISVEEIDEMANDELPYTSVAEILANAIRNQDGNANHVRRFLGRFRRANAGQRVVKLNSFGMVFRGNEVFYPSRFFETVLVNDDNNEQLRIFVDAWQTTVKPNRGELIRSLTQQHEFSVEIGRLNQKEKSFDVAEESYGLDLLEAQQDFILSVESLSDLPFWSNSLAHLQKRSGRQDIEGLEDSSYEEMVYDLDPNNNYASVLLNAANNIIKSNIDQREIIDNFKQQVEGLRIRYELPAFNQVDDQENFRSLVNKCNCRQMNESYAITYVKPSLVDKRLVLYDNEFMDNVDAFQDMTTAQLLELKAERLEDVPRGIFLPSLNATMVRHKKAGKQFREMLDHCNAFEFRNAEIYDFVKKVLHKNFFLCLRESLDMLNGCHSLMREHDKTIIAVLQNYIENDPNVVYVFPHRDYDEALFYRMPLDQLLSHKVAMNFSAGDATADVAQYMDILDLEMPMFMTIFHAMLQMQANQQFLMLAQTIVGRNAAEVKALVRHCLMNVDHNAGGVRSRGNGRAINSQLIVVEHDHVNNNLAAAIPKPYHQIICTTQRKINPYEISSSWTKYSYDFEVEYKTVRPNASEEGD